MAKKPLYQAILEQVRYQIISGEWQIGSSLPAERKLAEKLGVSRNTVVRVFEELENEGLIVSKMGSGRYVQPLPPATSLSQIDWQQQLPFTKQPSPSHIADLLDLSPPSQDVINFAHGDGGKDTVLRLGFHRYLEKVAKKVSSYYFLSVDGHPELRRWVVDWMNVPQITSKEEVVITSGSQEALYLITQLLAKPGDAIALEIPSFLGALQVFQSLGIRMIPIPIDEDGMRLEVLESVLTQVRPRFIYTIPTFHNPTGFTLSYEKRKRLMAISEKYRIPIVEDDAYRHLHLEKEPPPSLMELDQVGSVIYINTFSKILFPGIRIGWVAAHQPFIEHIRRAKEMSITNNTFGQLALLDLLQDGLLPSHLQQVRKQYRLQAERMGYHLERLRPIGISYSKPEGGFYYWVSLPAHLDATDVLKGSLQHNVSFAHGNMFLPRKAKQPYIRLCFTHENCEQIDRGMNVISHVITHREEFRL